MKFEGPRPNSTFGPAHNKQVTAGRPDPYFRETLAPLYNFPIVLLRAPSPQPRRRRRYNRAPRFLSRRRDGTPPLFFLPLSLRQRIVPPVDFVCARMIRSYGSFSSCAVARDPSVKCGSSAPIRYALGETP